MEWGNTKYNLYRPLAAGLTPSKALPVDPQIAHHIITRANRSTRRQVGSRMWMYGEDSARFPMPPDARAHHQAWRAAQETAQRLEREAGQLRVEAVRAKTAAAQAQMRYVNAQKRAKQAAKTVKQSLNALHKQGGRSIRNGSWDQLYVGTGVVRPANLPSRVAPAGRGKLRRGFNSLRSVFTRRR